MFFDLLHFGSGPQAVHYFVLCFVATIGTIQGAAVRYDRRDLIWIYGTGGYVLAVLLFVSSFVWFFLTDEEIFIPGLAGGEFFVIFVAAFFAAVPVVRLVSLLLVRARVVATVPERTPRKREKEPLL